MNTTRLHNIDYLRGLAASSIVLFHYFTWSFGEFPAETVLRRIGIYGVSIFYILSGLTLYHVYFKKITSVNSIINFFKKRVLRIFPLLWLATITSILLSRQVPDLGKLLLNLTGLFGLVSWDDYYAVGVWSIGNELVFYLFFPIFVLMTKKSNLYIIILSIILFAVYLYFSFGILDSNKTLSEQWKDYVNPLNQVFLFLGGYHIGFFAEDKKFNNTIAISILSFGVLLLCFFPAYGDPIHLVTGVNRLVFTFSCILICIGFYKIKIEFPHLLNKILGIVGESSYSIYLLHPLVWSIIGALFSVLSINNLSFAVSVKIFSCFIVTFISSYFVYQKFEKYFMKLGRS